MIDINKDLKKKMDSYSFLLNDEILCQKNLKIFLIN